MMLIFIVLLALALGSFANCLIWRLFVNKKITGRSICPKCGHQLRWFDNIPLISFLILNGACRYCHKKISWQYFLVELSMAFLFILNWYLYFDNIFLFIKISLAIFFLIIIFTFDLKYYLIPINFLLITSPLIYIFNILSGAIWWQVLLFSLSLSIFFLVQYIATSKKGIGEGDIWLGAALGLMLTSWSQVFVLIIVSYFLGSFIGILLLIFKKKKWSSKLPLGVFLAVGALTALFFTDFIWFQFLKLFI